MSYFRVDPVAVSESAGFVDFVIRLDVALAVEARVSYGIDAGTAAGNQDFRGRSGTLIFAPGETSKTVRVELLDGNVAEPTEVFWIDLNTAVNAVVAQRWTPALIFDNDAAAGTPGLVVGNVSVDETARTANFFVYLTRPAALSVSVSYATADGTAAAGQDYQATAGLLNFGAGEMVKTVSVPLIDDNLAENDEFFHLVLANPSGATLAAGTGSAMIGRNDAPPVGQPQVLSRAVAVGEGETLAQFLVYLSAPSTNEVRVNFGIDAGTAAGNTDFRGYSGTLVFAPGETLKTVPVPVIDDTAAEPTEIFWLDLNTAVNAVVPQRWTPALIFDNDGATGTPAITAAEVVVDETAQRALVVVALDRPSVNPVTVAWTTADDTAMAGEDFRPGSGVLRFEPGETVRTISVDVFDDALAERDEFFHVVLSNPAGATLADAVGSVMIARNDTPPVGRPYIGALPLAACEGDTVADFVVYLSAPSPNEVRVNFGIDAGTAAGNADFRGYSGTLVFAPGETVKTLPVPVIDDTAAEPTEVFWLDLNTAVNAVVPQRWTPALIVDNDGTTGAPAVSIGDAVVDESAQLARLFVTLSRPSLSTVTVPWATADDTARAGSDFVATSGVLSFAPGETVKTVTVNLIDDELAESDEFFQVLLGNPGGATLADAVGAVMVSRNDTPPIAQPQVLATPLVVAEGVTLAKFVVQLSAASSNEVRVNFNAVSGTAAGNADFRGYAGTLVFAPGETVKTLPVPIIDDTVAEGTEIFNLDLNSPVNATVPQRYTSATLIDNDSGFNVYSHGLGNDRYTVTSVLDRIAEGPRGGIDTVSSSVSFTLPDNVENLVLTGTAANGIGNAGNNVFRGNAANNTFDGREGIDTVVFSGAVAAYTVSGSAAQRTVASTADGSNTLFSIERLQFTDTILATDTNPGGHVWGAYAMFNAAFDRGPDMQELSQWTAQLDRLEGNLRDLAQAMINHYAPGVPDDALVAHLWSTITGTPIPFDALQLYVGLLGNRTYTQASLLELVTTIDLNTVELVGIVGQTLALDPAYFPPPG